MASQEMLDGNTVLVIVIGAPRDYGRQLSGNTVAPPHCVSMLGLARREKMMLKVFALAAIALPTIAWAQTSNELQSYLEQQQAEIDQDDPDSQQSQAQQDTDRQQRWWDETMQQSRPFEQED
jgi:hypothetical protein